MVPITPGVKRFPRVQTRAGMLAVLFADVWWAVELSAFDVHREVRALDFVERLGGDEFFFDVTMWALVAVTFLGVYRGTRRTLMAMAFANLAFWSFTGFQLWQGTQTHLVPALCFALAIGSFARIVEVSRPDGGSVRN